MTAQLVVNHERTFGGTDWMRIRGGVGDEREFVMLMDKLEAWRISFTAACSKMMSFVLCLSMVYQECYLN